MANNMKPMTTRNARIGGCALLIGIVLFSAHAIRSQEDAANGAQARQSLKVGTDKFKQGDYETAAGFFKAAEVNRLALTPAEQKDLNAFGSQNTNALKSRQDAGGQLSLAEDALKQGRLQDAGLQMKSLQANQYLTKFQTDQVADLNKRLVAKGGTVPKIDAKALLASGRAALQAGDLASAESYTHQAEKSSLSVAAWLQPWSDSPAKLRRDIQTAREKAQAPLPVPTVDIAKNLEPQPPPEPKKSAPSKLAGLWPFGSGPKNDPAEQRINDKIGRHMVKDGFFFLQANDLDKAYMCATEAKKLNLAFDPNDPQTPDTLLHEIQRRRGGGSVLPPTPMPTPTPKQADIFPVPKVLGDPPAAPAEPHAQLRKARSLLTQNKYDESDKICGVLLSSGTRWGLFEDTPEKLRRDIQRQRQTSEREESFKVLADARKLFTQGNYADSEKKAFIAQKMHGPYGVFDFGDRPQKLLEEISKVKLAKGITPTPKDELEKSIPLVAADVPKKADPLPTISAAEQQANKNRAIVIVREAMELERQGRFYESRQKALEAKIVKATFGPDEPSPDAVVVRLNAKCEQQIQFHLQKATEAIVNPGDPQRFEKAQAELAVAREVAQAFQFDTSRIDQTAMQFHQIVTGSKPVTNAQPIVQPTVDPLLTVKVQKIDQPTGDPQKDELRRLAREKLHHAQLEVAHGNLTQARRMCEELYRADPGLQAEIIGLIATISAEEYNQQVLSAKNNFDVGLKAFAQKDYRKALAMFQALDPNMLPEQHKIRLRDIISTKEMQPPQIAQVGGQEFMKGTTIVPKGDPGGLPDQEPRQTNLMDEVQAKQQVHYQMVRQRGQDSIRSAHDQFRNGQKEQAIKTLEGYIEQIGMTGFDPLRANELKRPAEARIQQYRTVMAREKFDAIESDSKNKFARYYDEAGAQRKKQTHHQEVFEKMKLVTELIKQNKLKEAQVEVELVRSLDPDNPAALAARTIIHTRLKQESYDRDIHANNEIRLDLNRPGLGVIPKDGSAIALDKEVSGRRSKGDNGSIQYELKHPKERAIEYRLRQPISLNFKDMPLQDAIAQIGLQSGVPVLPDRRALQEARISLDAPLTESIPDIEMRSALNILLKPLRLTFVIEDQVLKITTEDNRIRMRRITYPVGDLIVAVEDHPLPDVFNVQKMIEHQLRVSQPYYGQNAQMAFPMNAGMPVSSHNQGNGSMFGSQTPGSPPTQQTKEKTKEAMAEMLKTLIQEIVAKNSWEGMGGTGAVQYFPQGMALVINQQQEVQEEIGQLLAALRKLQDLQVTVEMRAVVVSETFFERIGLDFDMNIRTPTSRAEPTLIAGGPFTPAPFNNRNLDRLGGLISGLTSGGVLTPDLNIPVRNSTFNFTTPQFGGYQPEAGLSLGLAFLSDIQVFMFLEAVQGDRRAHIMQAPRITLFNGQQGFINGQVQRPIFSGFVPITLPTGMVVMSAINTPFPFGMGMQVQPVVSPDRRFIRLNVQPQFGSPLIDTAAATVLVQSGSQTGTFDSGVQPPLPNGPLQVQIQPTSVNLFTSNTTVNVPDGGTVVLGGFRFLAEERTEYGPPILSKIPYLSRLFRNVGWSRDGGTLIFLVTARIISIEEEEQILLGTLDPIPR